jgi:hypothetical protein
MERVIKESMAREIYEFKHDDVGHTLIGSWIPGRYVQVFTHWDDGTKPLFSPPTQVGGFTTVMRCDEFGLTKLNAPEIYGIRYETLDEAKAGHLKTVEHYSRWYRF